MIFFRLIKLAVRDNIKDTNYSGLASTWFVPGVSFFASGVWIFVIFPSYVNGDDHDVVGVAVITTCLVFQIVVVYVLSLVVVK